MKSPKKLLKDPENMLPIANQNGLLSRALVKE